MSVRVKLRGERTMSSPNASALFWWLRSELFFDQQLAGRDDVFVCRYEALVSRPRRVWRSVYEFLGRDYPGDAVLRGVSNASQGRGLSLELDRNVRALCGGMLERFDAVPAPSPRPPAAQEQEPEQEG